MNTQNTTTLELQKINNQWYFSIPSMANLLQIEAAKKDYFTKQIKKILPHQKIQNTNYAAANPTEPTELTRLVIQKYPEKEAQLKEALKTLQSKTAPIPSASPTHTELLTAPPIPPTEEPNPPTEEPEIEGEQAPQTRFTKQQITYWFLAIIPIGFSIITFANLGRLISGGIEGWAIALLFLLSTLVTLVYISLSTTSRRAKIATAIVFIPFLAIEVLINAMHYKSFFAEFALKYNALTGATSSEGSIAWAASTVIALFVYSSLIKVITHSEK